MDGLSLPAATRAVWPDRLTLALVGLVLAVSALSLGSGAASLPLHRALSALAGIAPLERRDAVILYDIRLPRLAMALLVGAALAVAGALMQGLFRNPLADPGLVGVGAGAGLVPASGGWRASRRWSCGRC